MKDVLKQYYETNCMKDVLNSAPALIE